MNLRIFSFSCLLISTIPIKILAQQESNSEIKTNNQSSEKSDSSEKQPKNIEVISVTGSRIQKTNADEVSKIEISSEQAELVAPDGDVAQVPKLFPGTSYRPTDAEVSIRGSDTNNSLYYIDDIEAPVLFEPISGTSVIPSRAVESLSYYPGNFDVEYGNSNGGVIKLETRGEDIIEPYSEFRFNFPQYISAYHEQEAGENGSLILSLRKSILEGFISLIPEETLEGNIFLPYFQDAYLQYYYGGDDFSIKSRYVHSRTGATAKVYNDRSQETDGTSNFDFANDYDVIATDIETELLGLNLEFSPFIVKSMADFSFSSIRFKNNTSAITLPIRTQLSISPTFNIFMGIESDYRENQLEIKAPILAGQGEFTDFENSPLFELETKFQSQRNAAWSSFEFKLGPLLLNPGLRIFNQSNIKNPEIDPRISARYQLDDSNTIKSGIGQFSSPPSPQQLAEDFGNPELSWIRSNHYTLGWESIVDKAWSSDLQVFYKTWFNEVLENSVDLSNPSASTSSIFTNGTTRNARGLEWFYRYTGDSLFGWVSYTYSSTKESRGGGKEIPSNTDITNIVHLVANYKINPTFQMSSRIKHQTGYVYTPVDQVWYEANTDIYQPEESLDMVNGARVPDTTSITVYGQNDYQYDTWKMILRYGVDEYQLTKSSPNFNYNYDYTTKEYVTGVPFTIFTEIRAIL